MATILLVKTVTPFKARFASGKIANSSKIRTEMTFI